MGVAIQGPWKKRIVRQIIEHELLILARAEMQLESNPIEPSRWPIAKAAPGVAPAPVGEQHR